ncbi:MAG: aldehyde ferredoxin oxidoreductase C-terminal domain-containing protein [Chloroflexota bacterium]
MTLTSVNVLRVDLSKGTTTLEAVPEDVLRTWVGGTGLGVHYLMSEVQPGIEWDDPANLMCIMTGPLANTRVSGTGTISCVFKGPMTNLAGATQANGFLGAFMRSQGIYGLVIQGQAKEWTHLHLGDDGPRLESADNYVGLGVWEMEDKLRADYGMDEKQLSVFGIGQAGEHLVRFAAFAGDRGHVASHNGVGAVLGSKKLKVISAKRGKVRPHIANNAKLNELVRPLFTDAKEYGGGSLFNWGTAGGVSGAARGGWLPIKNYTTSIFPQHEAISGQYIRGHYEPKNNPCWACNMACCKLVTITDGDYKGFQGEEPEYEGMASMGAQVGVTDSSAAVYLSNLVDSIAVDVNEVGWLLGWVMECYEKGLLTKEQLDGVDMTWGNAKAIEAMLHKIANRDGCGEWLAEGVMRASRHIGGLAADMAIYSEKGQSPRSHDHRGRWVEMFDTCTSSTSTIEVTFGGAQVERLGLPGLKDRFSPTEIVEQMGHLNGWHQFDDSLGVCRFDFTNAKMGVETVAAITGWDLDLPAALKIGRRISAQLRIWSFLHGMDPTLERPSKRYGSVPIDGPAAGANIMLHWADMLRNYRTLLGWDPVNGIPTDETLRELDLAHLIPTAEKIRAQRQVAAAVPA